MKALLKKFVAWSYRRRKPSLRSGLHILLLHSIDDMKKFSNLIEALKKHGTFVDPDILQDESRNFTDQAYFLLSFDDGYRSSAEALDLAERKFSIRGLFFVATKWFESDSEADSRNFIAKALKITEPKELGRASVSQLQNLHQRGHWICSHSHTHRNFSELTPTEMLSDLELSENFLTKIGLPQRPFFAFPFGDGKSFSQAALQVCRTKFKWIFTGLRGTQTDLKKNYLFRQSLENKDSLEYNLAVLNGAFDFSSQGQRSLFEKWSES